MEEAAPEKVECEMKIILVGRLRGSAIISCARLLLPGRGDGAGEEGDGRAG